MGFSLWLSPKGFTYCMKPVSMVTSDPRAELLQLGAWRLSRDRSEGTNQWVFRRKAPVFVGWAGLRSADVEFQLDGYTVAGSSVANL